MKARRWANRLGWFSLGLGLAEVIGALPIAQSLGVNKAVTVRLFGLREIAAGLGLLTHRRKGAWVWARVAGDVLDLATLGAAFFAMRNRGRRQVNAALAIAAVAPVVAADVVCARELGFA